MEVNGGVIAFLAVLLPVVGTIAVSAIAQRSAAKNTEVQALAERNRVNEVAQAAQGGTFAQQFELQKYIDERVADAVKKATEELNRRVNDLDKAFRGAVAELSLIKNWARDYIKRVLLGWNTQPEPPKIDQHIIDLIIEDDLNGTLSPQQIADATKDTRP